LSVRRSVAIPQQVEPELLGKFGRRFGQLAGGQSPACWAAT